MIKLKTKNLSLLQITTDDRDLFENIHNDENVTQFICDPLSKNEIEARFIERLPEWRANSTHWLCLTIIEKSSKQKIGFSGLRIDSKSKRIAEVGFMLLPDFQRRGYATESLQAILKLAFQTLNLETVIANVTEGNEASLALLHKLGFKCKHIQQKSLEFNGALYDNLELHIASNQFINHA